MAGRNPNIAADHPPAQRIAVVVHSLNRGGAQQRLVTLANAFAAAGREVHFVALRGGGDVDHLLDPAVNRLGLDETTKPLAKPWLFEGWDRLAAWLSTTPVDVIMAGITTVHFSAAVARGRMKGRKPLLVMRASRHPMREFGWSRPFKHLFEPVERGFRWRIYDLADLVIGVSRETADALRQRLQRPERVVSLPNPVITPAFECSLTADCPHPWLGAGPPVILAVGRLAWQKRFDVLLRAFDIVRRDRDARLIILGEGRFRSQLEAQVKELGLRGAIEMPGNVADVGAWMARADLLVSTSAFEGSPGVLIEALAAGLPVVATACPGGSVELLEDGVGGMLTPLDDPAATAAAIAQMLDRPCDRERLRKVAEPYTVAASAAAYLEALDEAAAARG